jgi:hypothetical protein
VQFTGVTDGWRARLERVALCVRYLLFTVAGLLLVIYPIRVVLAAIAAVYTYAGGGLLLLGGGLSLLGALFNRWSGEALGLPMAGTAFLLFGGVLLLSSSSLAGMAVGLIFLGVALGLVSRWVTVMRLLELAKRERDRR